MIIKTKSQLEKIFESIGYFFPEINPRLICLEDGDYDYIMGADVLDSGNILYNREIFGGYTWIETRGIMAHEFGHLVNQKHMKDFSLKEKKEHEKKYNLNPAYRRRIERAADKTAVLRGFGKEMFYLIFTSLLNEDWRKDRAAEHLSLNEIKRIMNSKGL
jgi:hypothetical protein